MSVPLTAASVAAAAGGRLLAGSPGQPIGGFSIDTRTLTSGDLFLAIKGERFDGHAFVAAALERGASGMLVSDAVLAARPPAGAVVIAVPDVVVALQALARHVRRKSGARVVAVTGSAGKTTTKETAAVFLGGRYSVFRNEGNLNNHIGLPLSLLGLRHGADVGVVELGMNHAGEIRALVGIAEPEVRVWTNVGPAHLAFFPSVEAIADAKAEIAEGASGTDVLVANADDPLVMERVGAFAGKLVTFGLSESADVRAVDVEDLGLEGVTATLHAPSGSTRLTSPLVGSGNLSNVLAAAAVALELGVPLTDIAEAASSLRPASHRGEVRRLPGGVTVIDDSYNSNPSALVVALRVVGGVADAGRKVAVLGEMLELGGASIALHEQCGREAAVRLDRLVTVGGEPARALGRAAVEAGLPAASVTHVDTSGEAEAVVVQLVRRGDVVLVKGSRGIGTETVVDRLVREFS